MAPLADLLALLAQRGGDVPQAVAHMQAVLPPRLHDAALDALLGGLCAAGLAEPQRQQLAARLGRTAASLTAAELDPPMRKRLLLWFTQLAALDAAYALADSSLDHFGHEGTVGGAWGVLWLPEMQPFRDDERFQLFARRLRLFEYWSEYGPPDGYSLAGERLVRAN
jgi:hypothetical protein